MFARRQIPRRVALVLGNGAYETDPLANPANDARAVAAVLEDIGFRVTVGVNLTTESADNLISHFLPNTERVDVAILYYSGHGIQIKDTNYIIPVDWDSSDETTLDQLISLQHLIRNISSRSGTSLIFLDACRNNPFVNQIEQRSRLGSGKGIGSSSEHLPRGLADFGNVEDRLGSETFVAFAAAPGKVAYEISGMDLSLFTAGLLAHISTTDLSLNHLMLRVSQYVKSRTDGQQEPWSVLSLTKPFYFSPGSLIWLTANLIGLAALIVSWFVSFYVAADRGFWWGTLPAIAFVLTLSFFIFGLNRSYSFLRGDYNPGLGNFSKSLVGGAFGGVLAGPVIAMTYYAAWSYADVYSWSPGYFFRPRFGLVLAEIATWSLLTSVIIGTMSFACAVSISGWRAVKRILPFWALSLIGGCIGGLAGGMVMGPALVWYFGQLDRPPVSPTIAIPGSIMGVSIAIFSIVSYEIERISYKKIWKNFLSVVSSALVVGVTSVGVFSTIYPWLIATLKSIPNLNSWKILAPIGIPVGAACGLMLGAVVGLAVTVISYFDTQTNRSEK